MSRDRRRCALVTGASSGIGRSIAENMARCGARIQEIDIEVPPRQEGTSMYHFWKTVFYPAKTLLCLALIRAVFQFVPLQPCASIKSQVL